MHGLSCAQLMYNVWQIKWKCVHRLALLLNWRASRTTINTIDSPVTHIILKQQSHDMDCATVQSSMHLSCWARWLLDYGLSKVCESKFSANAILDCMGRTRCNCYNRKMQAQISDDWLCNSTVLEPRVDWAAPVSHVHFSVSDYLDYHCVGCWGL